MEFIDISQIQTDNKYLRLDTNVDMLKKSIETVGIIHPLSLNDQNQLIAGGRRYTALKELGITQVPFIRIDKSEKEQELISIDENLVRRDLNKLEMEEALSRGKELYEEIYPSAKKVEEEDLTKPEDNEIQTDLPNEQRSFIDITAEKTGLSKKVIKSAIDREEKASDRVKEMRKLGDINATVTNEIIKLPKDTQEHVADLIKGKSAKEVKELVTKVNSEGLQQAVNEFVNAPNLPKEYKSLKTLLQRTNKVLAKILIEEMTSEHDDIHYILDQISTLRLSLDQLLVLASGNNEKMDSQTVSDEDYSQAVEDGLKDFGSNRNEESMQEQTDF